MYKKWMILFGIIGVILNFTGCNTTELEERCFPMMVSVGYDDGKFVYSVAFPQEDELGKKMVKSVKGSNFSESKKAYEEKLNRDADYNHLKVLVVDEDLLEQKNIYEEMLNYLEDKEEFPRNTYVCVVDEIEELQAFGQGLTQDIGTYLEEYLKKQESQEKRLLTLGDLIDEMENKTMVLYLPYLEVEENFIEWKGYVNTAGKIGKNLK